MSKNYFLNFPLTNYLVSGKTHNPIDITRRIKIRDLIKENTLLFYPYTVKEGERPDIIADKYYGDSAYFWLVMLSNEFVNPYFEWVLSEYDFYKFLEKKYGWKDDTKTGQEYAATNYKYYTGDGYEVDEDTYDLLSGIPAIGKYTESLLDIEKNINEKKRHISLVGKEYLDLIENEIGELLK